jgi:hypothetical protein
MAGGINAAVVPCLRYVGRAVRSYEGMENDGYDCSECGYQFSIDWSHGGPPKSPRWPLSQEEEAAAHHFRQLTSLRRKAPAKPSAQRLGHS